MNFTDLISDTIIVNPYTDDTVQYKVDYAAKEIKVADRCWVFFNSLKLCNVKHLDSKRHLRMLMSLVLVVTFQLLQINDIRGCTILTGSGTFTSPGYPTGYPNNMDECWILRADSDKVNIWKKLKVKCINII